jgi:hypothetical protein
MRTFGVIAMLLMFSLAGCKTHSSQSVVVKPSGDGAVIVPTVTSLHVLPAKLPDEFHGKLTEEDIERYRRDWPMAAARTISEGVTDRSRRRITAMARQEKPDDGHFFELEISYLDVGDPEARAANIVGGRREGWSLVLSKGKVVDAKSGATLLELEFSHSSGYRFKTPFENDMYNLGRELADRLEGRSR